MVDKKDKFSILENMKDMSYEEVSSLIEEGAISIDDVYMATIMESIWQTDEDKWPRA
jgi:hypothetical protein